MAMFHGNDRYFINHASTEKLIASVKVWRIPNKRWKIALGHDNCYIALPFLSRTPGYEDIAIKFKFIIKPISQGEDTQKIECSLKCDYPSIQHPNFDCKILFNLWNGTDSLLDAGNTDTSVSEFTWNDINTDKGYPLWDIKCSNSKLTSLFDENKDHIFLRFYIEFRKGTEVIRNQIYQLIENISKEKNYIDLDIICNETTIKTNKKFLASQSEVFQQMLQQPMTEQQDNKIIINDTTSSALKHMVSFTYSAKIDSTITAADMIELTYLADKYLMPTLKKECLMKLEFHFNKENIINMLILSDHCQLGERFDKRIFEYMKTNISKLVNDEPWRNLQKESPEMINKFILYILGRDNSKGKTVRRQIKYDDVDVVEEDI